MDVQDRDQLSRVLQHIASVAMAMPTAEDVAQEGLQELLVDLAEKGQRILDGTDQSSRPLRVVGG